MAATSSTTCADDLEIPMEERIPIFTACGINTVLTSYTGETY
jgi:hypothetical protein